MSTARSNDAPKSSARTSRATLVRISRTRTSNPATAPGQGLVLTHTLSLRIIFCSIVIDVHIVALNAVGNLRRVQISCGEDKANTLLFAGAQPSFSNLVIGTGAWDSPAMVRMSSSECHSTYIKEIPTSKNVPWNV
jgi:hypothetical protein